MTTASDKLLVLAIETGKFSSKLFRRPDFKRIVQITTKIDPSFDDLLRQYNGDVLSALANASDEAKSYAIRYLHEAGNLERRGQFIGIIPHVFRPTQTPIKGVSVLSKDKATPFTVAVPIDTYSTFMGQQYISIEFELPELDSSVTNQTYIDGAKFDYCSKPGIRLLPDIKFTSTGNTVQDYDYLDVLRIDNELIYTSAYEKWNYLIGHDLFTFADVYNQATQITYGVPTKNGYQTPRSLDKSKRLKLTVPLFFHHNREFANRLNLNSFLAGSLEIQGNFCPSDQLVRARYFPDDVEEPVVDLKCKPLKVRSISLITNKFFVGDELHSIMSNKQIRNMVKYFSNHRSTIVNDDPMEEIPVDGHGYVEAVTLALRPESYKNDFDKWRYLSPVSHECSPTVVVTKDNLGELKKLSIKPADVHYPVSPLEAVGMFIEGGDSLKPMMDPEYYSIVEPHRCATEFRNYYPRDNILYKFIFNYHLNQEIFSGLFAQTKLENTYIGYKFKDEYIDQTTKLLKEPWEYIVFRDLCNQQYGTGSSLTSLYMK